MSRCSEDVCYCPAPFAQPCQVALRRQAQPPDFDLFSINCRARSRSRVMNTVCATRFPIVIRNNSCQVAIAPSEKQTGRPSLIPGASPFDDVADMFEIDDIVEDGNGLPPLALARIATQTGQGTASNLCCMRVDALPARRPRPGARRRCGEKAVRVCCNIRRSRRRWPVRRDGASATAGVPSDWPSSRGTPTGGTSTWQDARGQPGTSAETARSPPPASD